MTMRVYEPGREAVMRICTGLLALCAQSGADATLETPMRARNRSSGEIGTNRRSRWLVPPASPWIAPLI
jgi:hypothetical protein